MTFTINDNDMAPATAENSTDDTTLAFSPTSILAVNKLAILPVVWGNPDGTNSDSTTFLSVTDTKSNTWFRAVEAQYSGGTKDDGVLAGIFYSTITTQIEVTDTITITSTATASGKGCTLATFNRDSAKTVEVVGTGVQRLAASASYSVTIGSLTSEEHLWVGNNAVEESVGVANSSDAAWSWFEQGASTNWGSSSGTQVSAHTGYTITTSTTETYDRATLDAKDRVTVVAAFREVTGGAAGAAVDPMGMSGFFGG